MIHLLAQKIDIYHFCEYPGRAFMDICLHIVEIHDFIYLPTLHFIRLRNHLQTERQVLLKGGIRRAGLPQKYCRKEHIRQQLAVIIQKQCSFCATRWMCSVTAGQSWQQSRNKILHNNKIATVFYTWAQSYGVSTQQPSVLHLRSLMALLHQHGHLCSVVQGWVARWDTCVPDLWSVDWEWFSCRRVGLHKLKFFAKAPNNHSLSLSASVRPYGGTSHPQLLHSCHTCTLALHAPPGGTSAPEGYVYNSICVLIWKGKLQGKRMCWLLYNSEREIFDLAIAMWLNTKTPVQKNSSQNLKLDKWEQNYVSIMNDKRIPGLWNHKGRSKAQSFLNKLLS